MQKAFVAGNEAKKGQVWGFISKDVAGQNRCLYHSLARIKELAGLEDAGVGGDGLGKDDMDDLCDHDPRFEGCELVGIDVGRKPNPRKAKPLPPRAYLPRKSKGQEKHSL